MINFNVVANGITLAAVEELNNPTWKDKIREANEWLRVQMIVKEAIKEWLMAPTCSRGELSGKEWRAILEAQKK